MEFNAGGHLWDLKLKSNQPPINAAENMLPWQIDDTYKVEVEGTPNDSRDQDRYWLISGRISWDKIAEGRPQEGERWAYNFMRINYAQDGRATYWVAKSTGQANIHYPSEWPVHVF